MDLPGKSSCESRTGRSGALAGTSTASARKPRPLLEGGACGSCSLPWPQSETHRTQPPPSPHLPPGKGVSLPSPRLLTQPHKRCPFTRSRNADAFSPSVLVMVEMLERGAHLSFHTGVSSFSKQKGMNVKMVIGRSPNSRILHEPVKKALGCGLALRPLPPPPILVMPCACEFPAPTWTDVQFVP